MIRHLLESDVLEEEVRSQIEQVDDYEEKRHEWNKRLIMIIDDRSGWGKDDANWRIVRN